MSWEATLKRNGRKLAETVLHRFTFKNGRVVDWHGSEDTAEAVKTYKA